MCYSVKNSVSRTKHLFEEHLVRFLAASIVKSVHDVIDLMHTAPRLCKNYELFDRM